MRPAIAALLLFALTLSAGDDSIPPHILNLARIEHRMADELKRLPNYTCMETIDRYDGPRGSRMKLIDRIRINVAIVDGKELYAWPGAKSFDDRPLDKMVGNGFTSDGDFASMTRNVFLNRTATITFAGPEQRNGRALLRYNFEIPQMRSGWQVRLGNGSGIVGAKGWFLADAATYDLVAFSYGAQDLPPFSPDKAVNESVEYGRVKLRDTDILLPLTADLEAEAFDNKVHWNHETFSACRQYAAESSISFGDDDSGAPNAISVPLAEVRQTLPPGIEIPLRLDTPIDSAHSAVGDEIRAVVTKNMKIGNETILPRGAVVKGFLRRLDRQVGNRPYYAVGIEFAEAEFNGQRAIVFGKLGEIARIQGFHRNVIGFDTPADVRLPGVGYFYVEGDSLLIPKGLSLTWITQTVRTR